MKIVVSACLLGDRVRYDGGAKLTAWIKKLEEDHALYKMCPEVAGGLPVPRDPAEIRGSSQILLKNSGPDMVGPAAGVGETATGIQNSGVCTSSGQDVTGHFLKGAQDTLKFCLDHAIKVAVLKERSPSCGKSQVYDGSHSGRVIPGTGLTAELLSQHGIRVFTEEDRDELLEYCKISEFQTEDDQQADRNDTNNNI